MSGEKEKKEITQRRRSFIAALRSGQWKQTTGKLCHTYEGDRSYCCLGVACEVAIADGLNIHVNIREGRVGYGADGLSGSSTTTLPEEARTWFGFAEENPWLKVPAETAAEIDSNLFHSYLRNGRECFTAVELNDEHKLTFLQIADCVEYTFLPEDWEVTRAAR